MTNALQLGEDCQMGFTQMRDDKWGENKFEAGQYLYMPELRRRVASKLK